jgi:hypothetical protein
VAALGAAGWTHVVVAEPMQSAGTTPPAPALTVNTWPLASGGLTRMANVGSSPMNRSPECGLIARPMTYVYVETFWPGFSSESYGATAEETTSWKPVFGL